MSDASTAIAAPEPKPRKAPTATAAPASSDTDAVLEALATELERAKRELPSLRMAVAAPGGEGRLKACERIVKETTEAIEARRRILRERVDREAQERLQQIARTEAEKAAAAYKADLKNELQQVRERGGDIESFFATETEQVVAAAKALEEAIEAFEKRKGEYRSIQEREEQIIEELHGTGTMLSKLEPKRIAGAASKFERFVRVCEGRGARVVSLDALGITHNVILSVVGE